jgi:hypothetical protein
MSLTTFLPTLFSTTSAPDVIPVDEYKQDPELVKAVQKATNPAENCAPNITEDTNKLADSQKDSISTALGAMGVQTCKSSSASLKFEAQAKGYGVNLSTSAGANYQTQMGCEQVNVISNIMSQCTKQLSCMLNEIQSSSTVNVKEFQKISIKVGDISGSTIKAGNLSETKVKIVNIGQSTVQSAIGATLTQGVNSAIDQQLDLASGASADASSQKSMTQVLQNLKSVASNTTINKSVATATANMWKDQEIVIEAGNIKDTNMDISNVSKIDLISENYVYNTLDQMFKTDAVQSALSEVVQKTTATKKGLFDFSLSSGETTFADMIISIVIVFVIGAIVVYVIKWKLGIGKKKKKQQNNKQQNNKQQNNKQKD